MKRIFVWLALLVILASAWLAFTEGGREFRRSRAAAESPAAAPSVAKAHAKDPGRPAPQGLVLIPARPAPSEPALRVHVTGRRTAAQEHGGLAVGAVVTDAQGRRSGIDTINGADHREIPDSSVERRVERDAGGRESEALVVTVKPAASTVYALEITGKPGGEYQLAVSGVSPALQSTTVITQGHAPADTSVHYRIDLTKIRTIPYPAQGGMVAGPVNPAEEFLGPPETRVKVSSYESLSDVCARVDRAFSRAGGAQVQKKGGFTAEGKDHQGCEVVLSGNRKKPESAVPADFLYPFEGSEMYYRGWKADREADGPDGTSYRIQNPTVFCLVAGSWDGGADDDPSYKPSDDYRLTVQCAGRPDKT